MLLPLRGILDSAVGGVVNLSSGQVVSLRLFEYNSYTSDLVSHQPLLARLSWTHNAPPWLSHMDMQEVGHDLGILNVRALAHCLVARLWFLNAL
jgi:hypothetical protein